jgi:uncharacterized protein YoxC
MLIPSTLLAATSAAALPDMLGWVGADLLPLLQAAAQATARTLPDTIITKQVVAEPGALERAAQALRALMTLAIVVLTFAVVPAAWNFRKSYQKVSEILDRVYADVTPIAHHASRIAENVDYVSSAVRSDVQRVSEMVADAEARLRHAIGRAERRARELEALLEVAQGEAEETFVSTASAVRGVRAGVAALRGDLSAARRAAAAELGRPAWRAGAAAGRDLPGDLSAEVPEELAPIDARDAGPPRGVSRAAGALDDDFDDDLYLDYPDLAHEEPDDAHPDRAADAPERPRVRPRRGRRLSDG